MSVYDNGCILTQHSPVQDLEVLLVFSEGGSVAEASHFRQSVPAFGGSLQGQRAMVVYCVVESFDGVSPQPCSGNA